MADIIRQGLSGPRGLLMAIIAQAADDLSGNHGRELQITSYLYFKSPLYRGHLERLGLDPEIYTMDLDRKPRPREVIRYLTRRGKKSHLYSYFMASQPGQDLINCLGDKTQAQRLSFQLAYFGIW